MQNEESMDALSEVLKDLVQNPIKSIYKDSISGDIETVKTKLNRVGAISDQISAVQTSVEEKYDDIENQLNSILDHSKHKASKLAEVVDSLNKTHTRLDGVAGDTLEGNENIIALIEEKTEALNKGNEEVLSEMKSLLAELVKVNSELKCENEAIELRELKIIKSVRNSRWASIFGFSCLLISMFVFEFNLLEKL